MVGCSEVNTKCPIRSILFTEEEWNRRAHIRTPRDLAYEDFRTTGNPAAAAIVADELMLAAQGVDLDRAVTEEDMVGAGFVRSEIPNDWSARCEFGIAASIWKSERWGWLWSTSSDAAEHPLRTLRQFRQLCGVFGITPRA